MINITKYLLLILISSCRQQVLVVKSPENISRDRMHNVLIAVEFILQERSARGYSDHESYCRDVQAEKLVNDINNGGYSFERNDLLDGWGNPFQISFDKSSKILNVRSSGEDKMFKTNDDIIESKTIE